MHRLSGEDAGFLAMEQAAQPLNTQAIALLGDGPPLTRADVVDHLAARLDQLPSFRWRIVPVPLKLHHPVAVRDPDVDLDFHVRVARVAAPGGDAEVDALFASLAERRLDRRHPLWQVTLVDGLAGGRQALILKYHHCLADGVAALTTFSRVFSDAERAPIPGAPVPWAPEPLPGRLRLVADAVRDHLRSIPRLVRLARRTRRGTAAVKARKATAAVTVPGFSGEAPRTPFNDAFTIGRTYARVALPLDEVKRIKDVAGTSLNDVALAIVAGGARTHLQRLDALPDRPLLTTVPVAYEAPDAPERQAGNAFWSFTTSLATHVADPWERLAAISAVAAEGKAQLDLLGPDLVPTWLDHVPPLLADPGAKALLERLEAATTDVDANVLVSNIRGPAERWSLLGHEVEELYIDGPPSNGVGANVMLWSYGDRLLLGLLCFADAVGDPSQLAADIVASFEELAAAATHATP